MPIRVSLTSSCQEGWKGRSGSISPLPKSNIQWLTTRSTRLSFLLSHSHSCMLTKSTRLLKTSYYTSRRSLSTMTDRLSVLRSLLSKHSIDAYLVDSGDQHASEYLAPCDERRVMHSLFPPQYLPNLTSNIPHRLTSLVSLDQPVLLSFTKM